MRMGMTLAETIEMPWQQALMLMDARIDAMEGTRTSDEPKKATQSDIDWLMG